MKATIPSVKIAIVDDHTLFRKGLIKLINMANVENKYSILFEADHGKAMQEKLNGENIPDIILMDIDMPDMDGYDAVKWLKENYPGIKILVISTFATDEAVVRMFLMKVNGYLTKDIEVEDMHKALEAISSKGVYHSDFVFNILTKNLQTGGAEALHGDIALTEREIEFMRLACTEMTYDQIADEMYVSSKTVDTYRSQLFKKLKVKTRVALALYAVKHGIYTP